MSRPQCGQDFMAGTICSDAPGHAGPHSAFCQNCTGDWSLGTCRCSCVCDNCGAPCDERDWGFTHDQLCADCASSYCTACDKVEFGEGQGHEQDCPGASLADLEPPVTAAELAATLKSLGYDPSCSTILDERSNSSLRPQGGPA